MLAIGRRINLYEYRCTSQNFANQGVWSRTSHKFACETMTAEEQQKWRALKATLLPTRAALYEDQEVLQKVPVIRLGKEALQNTKPRPVSPYYSDMSLKMAEQFNKNLKGEVSPEQAVKTLQDELQQIVEQGG